MLNLEFMDYQQVKIMKDYFKTFNKEIQNNRDLQSDKNFKIPAYTGLDLIAKGLCE